MAAVAHPTRPTIRRNSPLAALHHNPGFSADALPLKYFDVDESDSDDEPPPAIKFSKVTQALLADAPIPLSPPRQERVGEAPRFNRSTSSNKTYDTPSRAPGLKIVRKSSPSVLGHGRGGTPPRIVQIGSKGSASGKRSISISGPYPQRFAVKRDPTPEPLAKAELVTPAPAPRALRVTRTRTGSNGSQDGPAHQPSAFSRPGSRNGPQTITDSEDQKAYAAELGRSTSSHHVPETISRYGSSAVAKSRNTSADTAVPPSSQRIKRAPTGVTGSFLKSGPVRRGFRRRESEDNVSPGEEGQHSSASQVSASDYTPYERSASGADASRDRRGRVDSRATSAEPISVHDFVERPRTRPPISHLSRSQTSNDSRPGSRQASHDLPHSRQPSVERYQSRRQASIPPSDAPAPVADSVSRRPSIDQAKPKPLLEQKPPQRVPSLSKAQYRYAAPKLHTDASEDQENMPPPTFKRNKDQEFRFLGKSTIAILSDDEKPKQRKFDETPVPVPHQQQERKALGAISGNTPHRAAPAPPPKMSVLDTATTTAGASVTKSKKKRSHIVVNGKIFTQMGRIGKGGSSDVYCVMAENYKTFALKRVKLADCDESAVRGYKGEIDLLKKLTEVERVVRLFDWELNDDKQELCVLMEKGDTDLNRILTLRLNGVDATFDSAFARYHWREMLECVQAVHDYDIVHSDLKPANFLLVQGRLKLIDFGIANAIDTDNTCNVHRDSHVGTPNYMSPESITDTNAPQPGATRDEAGRPLKKDMRIGKASDVWSLGCILYQMTYGRPPFAHITNQISRIMAITDPKHILEFPDTGVGGALIPHALKVTLRRCLNRDPEKRPLIKEMLDAKDLWMNPDAQPDSILITEDLLHRVVHCVANMYTDSRDNRLPTPVELASLPAKFMEDIKSIQAR